VFAEDVWIDGTGARKDNGVGVGWVDLKGRVNVGEMGVLFGGCLGDWV